jgi:hypothetical protein
MSFFLLWSGWAGLPSVDRVADVFHFPLLTWLGESVGDGFFLLLVINSLLWAGAITLVIWLIQKAFDRKKTAYTFP